MTRRVNIMMDDGLARYRETAARCSQARHKRCDPGVGGRCRTSGRLRPNGRPARTVAYGRDRPNCPMDT